ncbi:MAG: 3'-5' exonuclease domain-containing protein 2 [Muribaculaceae bacterium]|nr:3'-5' exonuclease domain-containing protein 2 [Muribaculaceae bacterium]
MAYPAEITLVDSAAVAHSALRVLAREKAVGFDTETRPSFRKGQIHKVALMQISTADRCFLFRLNKIGICAELKEFLENPDILKIGLSVHDDFNVLRRSGEINPKGFVELQSMVHRYDITDISLQKIYAIIFGERISKSQRLTNWEAAELSPAQQAYAALDAWACLKIYNYLNDGQFDPVSSPYRRRPEPKPVRRPLPETKS